MSSVTLVRRFAVFAPLFALLLLLVAFSLVLADVTYQYDKDGRLICVGTPSGASYGYDSDGNITSIAHTICPTPTATATP